MDFKIITNLLGKPHLALAATLTVCILLFSPSSDLPDETPTWINDKVAHGTVFSGLAFLWMQYLRKSFRVIFFLTAFALGTEITQYLLPASFLRSFDIRDILADLAGVGIGLLLSWFFDRVSGRP